MKRFIIAGLLAFFWLNWVVLAQENSEKSGCFPPQGNILFRDQFDKTEEGPDGDTFFVEDSRWETGFSGLSAFGAYNSKEPPRFYGTFTLLGDVPEDFPQQAFVGDYFWKDYTLSTDIFFPASKQANGWDPWERKNQIAIFVRVQDPDNMVAFFLNNGKESGFRIKKNGRWQEMKATGKVPRLRNLHLEISVEGNNYTASVNNNVVAKMRDDTFSIGFTGLQMSKDRGVLVYFDNFTVRAIGKIGMKQQSSSGDTPSPIITSEPQPGNKTILTLSNTVDELSGQFIANEQKLVAHEEHFSLLDKQYAEMDSRMSAFEASTNGLLNTLQDMNGSLRQDLEETNRKIANIDAGVPVDLGVTISQLLEPLKVHVDALQATTVSVESKVEIAQEKSSEVETQLDAIEKDVNATKVLTDEIRRRIDGANQTAQLGLIIGVVGVTVGVLAVLNVI